MVEGWIWTHATKNFAPSQHVQNIWQWNLEAQKGWWNIWRYCKTCLPTVISVQTLKLKIYTWNILCFPDFKRWMFTETIFQCGWWKREKLSCTMKHRLVFAWGLKDVDDERGKTFMHHEASPGVCWVLCQSRLSASVPSALKVTCTAKWEMKDASVWALMNVRMHLVAEKSIFFLSYKVRELGSENLRSRERE